MLINLVSDISPTFFCHSAPTLEMDLPLTRDLSICRTGSIIADLVPCRPPFSLPSSSGTTYPHVPLPARPQAPGSRAVVMYVWKLTGCSTASCLYTYAWISQVGKYGLCCDGKLFLYWMICTHDGT